MLVYNIRSSKYAKGLSASGIANRWNKKNEFVIYASDSVALAALELVVHRNSSQIQNDYSLLEIKLVVDETSVTHVERKDLPKNWRSIQSYPQLQKIGSKWYQSQKSLLLEIPSVLVPIGNNFLINTKHPKFDKCVTIETIQRFDFDGRLR